jgi:glycosyltransferase involved in cell wall biosynthesis
MSGMRILLLGSKEYPFHSGEGLESKPSGGIEVHVEKLAKYLALEGHKVFLITRRFPGQQRLERLEKGKVTVLRVPFVNNMLLRTFTFNLFAFFRALGIARTQKIDVIHCHAQVAGFFGFFLSKLTGKPVIYTPHGIAEGWNPPLRYLLHLFDRMAVKGSRKVLFISPRAREVLGRHAKEETLLTNAIDLDDYKAATAEEREGTRFLFAGRLVEEKGIPILLQAFLKLQKDEPDAEMVIAGSGPFGKEIKSFTRRNPGLKIRFLGWRRDIPDLLSKTDAFVLPSQEKGQPIALLEAMSAGKVVITSLPYIEDGKTGLAFKAKSVDGLYKRMLYVCRNRLECGVIAADAKESVKNISWSTVVKDFLREYESAVRHG